MNQGRSGRGGKIRKQPVFDTPRELHELDFAFLTEQFPFMSLSSSVQNLDVTLDSSLTFVERISDLTCFYYSHLTH